MFYFLAPVTPLALWLLCLFSGDHSADLQNARVLLTFVFGLISLFLFPVVNNTWTLLRSGSYRALQMFLVNKA